MGNIDLTDLWLLMVIWWLNQIFGDGHRWPYNLAFKCLRVPLYAVAARIVGVYSDNFKSNLMAVEGQHSELLEFKAFMEIDGAKSWQVSFVALFPCLLVLIALPAWTILPDNTLPRVICVFLLSHIMPQCFPTPGAFDAISEYDGAFWSSVFVGLFLAAIVVFGNIFVP